MPDWPKRHSGAWHLEMDGRELEEKEEREEKEKKKSRRRKKRRRRGGGYINV